ncbi:hypothetical protein ABEB36_014164 [Hypothenemus hampei]|uniref:THAP-type domain-containing protein n=1 Tax=Hypothenemus hampei TaxID=57062 RepID=A0ABD1E3H6_HYPHA
MGFICCVPGCSNTSRKGFQMHMIPKDAELYNLWLTNIGRLDLKEKGSPSRVRKSYRVCNMHFGSEAMYIGSRNKSCIRKDAVPTLFLKNDISCHSYFSDDRNQPINVEQLTLAMGSVTTSSHSLKKEITCQNEIVCLMVSKEEVHNSLQWRKNITNWHWILGRLQGN